MTYSSIRHKIQAAILPSLLFLIMNGLIVSQAGAIVTPPLTKCYITIDDPHFSSSIRKKGREAVKVDASSRCNKEVTHLKLTVEIHKLGLLGDHFVQSETAASDSPVAPNTIFSNSKTFKECSNSKKTVYFGIAYATAIIDGKFMRTLRVLSAHNRELNCGT